MSPSLHSCPFSLRRKIRCRIERSQKPMSHQAPSSLPRSLAVDCGCSTEGYRSPKLAPPNLFSDCLELDQKGLVVDKLGKMNTVSMSVGHDASDNLIRRWTLLHGPWIRFFISLRIPSLKSSNFTRDSSDEARSSGYQTTTTRGHAQLSRPYRSSMTL